MVKPFLMLVQDAGNVDLYGMYDTFSKVIEDNLELRIIDSLERNNLQKYFQDNVILDNYEGVVLFLRFKKLLKQIRFLKTIKNIVFYEHDACQNYMEASKYKNKFIRFYKNFPNAKVIVSGFTLSQKISAEGIETYFIPKGCDTTKIQKYKTPKDRDINVSFIGSTNSQVYITRKLFLDEIRQSIPCLQLFNKLETEKYFETLNRSKIFISPDIGFSEYMFKNYEAMASGCVLLAYSQGDEENKKLGFVDGENILLFDSLDECIEKYNQVISDEEWMGKIGSSARQLINNNYSFEQIAAKLLAVLNSPFTNKPMHKNIILRILQSFF